MDNINEHYKKIVDCLNGNKQTIPTELINFVRGLKFENIDVQITALEYTKSMSVFPTATLLLVNSLILLLKFGSVCEKGRSLCNEEIFRKTLEKEAFNQSNIFFENYKKVYNDSWKLYKEQTAKIDERCQKEFYEKFEDMMPVCPISLEIITTPCFLPCGHRFERMNILRVESQKCPLCRSRFSYSEI